jgi:hypothetical protein
MSDDTLFTICNFGVLPFWLLLALAPRSRATELLVHHPVVPSLYGLVYGVLLVTGQPPAEGNMMSLEGVTLLFSDATVVTAGWIHYLVFDLFIGAWETRDARRFRIPHWQVVPCLAVTLMFGPLGLLSYLALRFARVRRLGFDEGAAPGAA